MIDFTKIPTEDLKAIAHRADQNARMLTAALGGNSRMLPRMIQRRDEVLAEIARRGRVQ